MEVEEIWRRATSALRLWGQRVPRVEHQARIGGEVILICELGLGPLMVNEIRPIAFGVVLMRYQNMTQAT